VSDLKISELPQLAGANLAANDLLAVADISASETRSITISDGIGKAVTLIADDTIPSAKILFAAGSVPGNAIESETVNTSQLANDAVSAAKLGDNSVTRLVSSLPATGDFVGQFALDTDDLKLYCWNGSTWQAIKAGGSVNTVIGGSEGVVNVTVAQTGDSVTLNTTLDATSAAGQFLAGPSGSAGSVSYRVIVAADLPKATTTAKGAVQVNGNGLTMSGDQILIDNTVTQNSSEYHLTQYTSKGLVTAGRLITAADLPAAGTGTLGAVFPGTGLSVSAAGQLNHINTATTGTYPKVTIDAQGHVTSGESLIASDIPDLPATKLTTGELNATLLPTNGIEGSKLANNSVTKIGGAGATDGVVVFPTADYNGQLFYDSLNNDLYLYDGNAWQPVTITAGEIIFAGTFDASAGSGTGLIDTLTTAGSALGLSSGDALPPASSTNNRYYFVVSTGGTITSGNAPNVTLAPPDMILSDGVAWTEVDVSTTVVAQQATSISLNPATGLNGTTVQSALEGLRDGKANKAGDTFTGNVTLNNVNLVFDTSGSFNTTLTSAANNTADRTITIPAQAGTMLVSGNASIVNADISASAAVAVSKLANGTARQLLQTNAGGTSAEWTSNVDIPGTLDVTGAAVFDSTLSVTGAATAPRFIPSGSTVPTNGMYLAAANNLSFAVNSTKRLLIDANGKSFFETKTGLNGGGLVIRSGSSSAYSAMEFTFGDIGLGNYCSIEALTGDLSTSNVLLNIKGAGIRFNASGSYDVEINTSGDLSVVGSTTAGSFIASGSTVPTNGMYLPSANTLGLAANSTERLTIDSNGKTILKTKSSIGGGGFIVAQENATNNPALYFGHVSSTTTNTIVSYYNNYTSYTALNFAATSYKFDVASGEVLRFTDGSEVLIGYTSDNGAYKLQVNSQIFATSSTIATSDGRYKENVATLGGCLDLVKALRPVSFTWKEQKDITRVNKEGKTEVVREAHNFPEGTQVGFIAQEVQEVLKDKPWLDSIIKENKRAAVKDANGRQIAPAEQFYGIAEGNLIAVLTSALQEAVERIESLESKLANL